MASSAASSGNWEVDKDSRTAGVWNSQTSLDWFSMRNPGELRTLLRMTRPCWRSISDELCVSVQIPADHFYTGRWCNDANTAIQFYKQVYEERKMEVWRVGGVGWGWGLKPAALPPHCLLFSPFLAEAPQHKCFSFWLKTSNVVTSATTAALFHWICVTICVIWGLMWRFIGGDVLLLKYSEWIGDVLI